MSIKQPPPRHTHPHATLYKMVTTGHAGSDAGNSCAQGSTELCPEPQGTYWGERVEKEYIGAIRGPGPPVPSDAKSSVPVCQPWRVGHGRAGCDQWQQRLPSSGTSATGKQTSSWGAKVQLLRRTLSMLLVLSCSCHSFFK